MSDALDKRKNTAALLHVILFAAVVVLNIIIAFLKINILSIILSAVAITFIAAFYLMSYKYYLMLSLFAISGILNFAFFRSAESLLLTVIIFCISCIAVHCYRKKYERVRILIITSVILLVFAVIYYLTYMFAHGEAGTFSDLPERIRADTDAAIEDVSTIYLEYAGYEPGDDPVQTEIDMVNVRKSLSLYIPGFFILSANIISFAITSVMRLFFNLFYKLTSYKRFLIDKTAWRIHLSLVSLLLIPLTAMLKMVSGANSNIVYLCAIYSVNFFLVPAVFVIGTYYVKDYIADNFYYRRTRIVTLAVIMVLLCFTLLPIVYYVFIIAGMIKESKYYFKIIEEKIKNSIDKYDDDDDDFD